jgi:hypothetical protein
MSQIVERHERRQPPPSTSRPERIDKMKFLILTIAISFWMKQAHGFCFLPLRSPQLHQSLRVSIVQEHVSARRSFLEDVTCWAVGVGISLLPSRPSEALSEIGSGNDAKQIVKSTKPFAPIEALVPAARVKLTIDRCVILANEIQLHPEDSHQNQKRQSELEQLLLNPQQFLRDDSTILNNQRLSFLPLSPPPFQLYHPGKAYMDTYDRNRRGLPLLFQPGAMLVQSGEINSWRRLKRQEAQRERQDEVRAALNAYTQALAYRADAYVLTVSAKERSQMVRQDNLPDVKQVIASDLGMRYLYRNQLLTSMSEVKAELQYRCDQQRQSGSTSMDVSELIVLLQDAQSACEQWFSLIEQDQVNAAVSIAQRETMAG